jgi:hypothetical protein
METIKYKSTGVVFGNYWRGGKGAYPAREIKADSREELLEQAKKGLDGSLDSGMGYESLIGALIEICKITTIAIDGKHFTNKEYETEFIGDLTEEEEDFLLECNFTYGS